MSDENKRINIDEIIDAVRAENKDSAWDGSIWLYTFLFMILLGGWGGHDTKDHELRERVARIEGQIDMIRREK